MWRGSQAPALPLEQRVALARKVDRLMALPYTVRVGEVELLCRAYGVSPRTGYRYAQKIRGHQCRCAECGRSI